MRFLLIACTFLLIELPLAVLASGELHYSSDYVDSHSGKTVFEIWKQATVTNPEILAAHRRLSEAKALRKQAALLPNPEIQINAGSSSILGESGDHAWGVSVMQTFELGGKRDKRIRSADLSIEIAFQEVREKERQVRWELKQAYAELLAASATIQTIQEALKLSERSHQITLARVAQGETAAVEQAVSEVELNRLKADLANLNSESFRAVSKLNTIIGVSQQLKIRPLEILPSNKPNLDLEILISQTLLLRPDFQISNLQAYLSEAEISLSKAEGLSDLDAFVEFTNERSRFDQFGIDTSGNPVPLTDQDNILSFGVSIQLPFFNRNQVNIQAAEARAEAARIRRAAMESAIQQQIRVALERLQVAQTNFQLFRDSIMEQSEKQLNILQSSYRAGEFRFLDLVHEQKRVLEIQKSYINSAKEYFTAMAEFEYVTAADLNGVNHE